MRKSILEKEELNKLKRREGAETQTCARKEILTRDKRPSTQLRNDMILSTK